MRWLGVKHRYLLTIWTLSQAAEMTLKYTFDHHKPEHQVLDEWLVELCVPNAGLTC